MSTILYFQLRCLATKSEFETVFWNTKIFRFLIKKIMCVTETYFSRLEALDIASRMNTLMSDGILLEPRKVTVIYFLRHAYRTASVFDF